MKDYMKGLVTGLICGILSVSAGIYIGLRASAPEGLIFHYPKSGLLSDSGRAEKLGYIEKIVDTGFLYDIDPDDLADGMYAGLMAGLKDPYSRYYTADEYEEETTVSEGNYSGVGIVMTMNAEGSVDITRVYEGSPAERAGILAGDVITAVDGLPVKGLTLSDVAGLIRNTGKDSAEFTIQRGEETLSYTVAIERVEIPAVTGQMLDESGTGYIRISEFTGVAPDQYEKIMASLKEQGLQKLIVDLRDNPGGYVTSVCDILRKILPEGVIFYTEDKNGNRTEETCDGKNELGLPLCVLVNENSASASEIFAGAVKDYGTGTLVGTTTFGKGVVQSIIGLNDGSAVKLTISEYFTPDGNKIHEIGITPDVVCEAGEEGFPETPDPEKDPQLLRAMEILDET